MKLEVGKGIDNYIKELDKLTLGAEPQIKQAVYVGGGIVADAIREAIKGLAKREGKFKDPPVTGVTNSQREGLLEGLGISRMQNDSGYINVHIGFDGYNSTVTDNWPRGVPNVLVARSLESGTSWLKKSPFIDPTVRSVQVKAEMAMAAAFDRAISKDFGG